MLCALSWKASFVVTRSCFALPQRRVSVVVASGWHTNFQRTCFFPSDGACGLAAALLSVPKRRSRFLLHKGHKKSFHPREVREFQYQIKAARRSPQCHGECVRGTKQLALPSSGIYDFARQALRRTPLDFNQIQITHPYGLIKRLFAPVVTPSHTRVGKPSPHLSRPISKSDCKTGSSRSIIIKKSC